MDSIYYIILGILLILAVFDLIVGVSNDAANFLNSAVGSRAASRRTILLVAGLGILLGSIFSSGMMEIARSGVFMPAQFHFPDVMMIFLAVMVADIILLDIFNTYGLPTSTTVSLIFGLLGAAVIVALFKINSGDPGVSSVLGDYINSTKALAIISAILSSVVVALTSGVVIMWISRLIFSFRYQKSFKWIGAIWCGIALTGITYFAIFKGLKGSSIVTKEMLENLNEHIVLYVAYSFVAWSVLMALLQHLFKINILKIAVLGGTMSLALAFAGNDLVNFIGVFMAAQSSCEIASQVAAGGGDISTLSMGDLALPVVADWRYLIVAGLIMVGALVFSKKARTVTNTEVNLSRQGGGAEQFGSIPPARFIVRISLSLGKLIEKITPAPVAAFIDKRFTPLTKEEKDGASFDLIRASVNLSVAALLISMATSLKLPLSTTYVTFMVAMGSSLADKAWGRDSAVYRITGVLTVVVGWFFTGFAAFTIAAIVAGTLMYFGNGALFVILPLVALTLIKSTLLHKKRRNRSEAPKTLDIVSHKAIGERSSEVCGWMQDMTDIYNATLEALRLENRKQLKSLRKQTKNMRRELDERLAREIIPCVGKLNECEISRGNSYIQIIEAAISGLDSLSVITRSSFNYIDNNHNAPDKVLIDELEQLSRHMGIITPAFRAIAGNNDSSLLDSTMKEAEKLSDEFADAIKTHVVQRDDDPNDMRAIILYMSLLNETRSMILKSHTLGRSLRKFAMES